MKNYSISFDPIIPRISITLTLFGVTLLLILLNVNAAKASEPIWDANVVNMVLQELSPNVYGYYSSEAKAKNIAGDSAATSGGFIVGTKGVLILTQGESDLDWHIDYLSTLIKNVNVAIDQGLSLEETLEKVTMSEFKGHVFFDWTHNLTVKAAYDESTR